MNKIMQKWNEYEGNNTYINALLMALSAYLCSFWATLLGEPSLLSIVGVVLNSYFLWKQKSLFDKIISSIVFNLVFAFFIDFTLYETTKTFLGLTDTWRLTSIIMISGLIRVPSHYIASLCIHFLQKHKRIVSSMPYFWIGVFAFILSVSERYLYLIVPTETGFAFLNFIEYLGLLPIFSLLIYSFLIYYISLALVFRLTLSKFSLKPLYFFITMIILSSVSISYFKIWESNYDQKDVLKIKVVQYPFHELKNNKENIDPEELMQKTLIPILQNNKSDLTLFSESSLPYIYENFHQLRQDSNINDIIQSKTDLLFSAIKKENKKLYNTSLLFRSGELPQVYYKKHLFPVGERELLAVTILNYGNKKIGDSLESKDQPVLFHSKKDFNFIPMQCFENYNPYYISQYPKNKVASFVTIQSNESWISDIRLRDLTKLFVQVRAVENALFAFKVDSMGPSFVVNPTGKIDYITYYPKTSFDYNVPKKVNNKFNYFFNYGILPFVIFFILHSLIAIFGRRKNEN